MGSETHRAFYNSVWGSSGTNVFAVGEDYVGGSEALVAHYDGQTWTRMRLPQEGISVLEDVFGSSATDVWVVGNI